MGVLKSVDEAPYDIAGPIREFWAAGKWDEAASIAFSESAWNAFALNNSTSAEHPCGRLLEVRDGVAIYAEFSVGYFQINACNLPVGWTAAHLYNGRHNAGTAHDLWIRAGESWRPWFFSARELGLL